MKILLVAATRSEIEPLFTRFADSGNSGQLIFEGFSVDILITGVGMVATAFALGRYLALNQYDLAVNAGIAGSFDFNIALGEVVSITEDIFAEQGAEDGNEFLSLKELGLGESSQLAVGSWRLADRRSYPAINLKSLDNLKQVKAITVNKVHGHELTISQTLSRFDAQVESMEGAAFFYACNQTKTPCLQIRAISNYVERRDKEKWNIGLAVKNLNGFLGDVLLISKFGN
jgi:futalosine hydrolase